MLSNYVKIAFRNLAKNRLFTFLNTVGLATGLAVSLLIGLYVRDECSYDAFNKQADRLYRINFDEKVGGVERNYAVSPAPMGPAFLRDYPAVEAMCRFRQWGYVSLRKDNESFEEGPVVYADSTLFQVFSLPLKEGDPRTALGAPNGIVLSEQLAHKYFGASSGVVGRILQLNETQKVMVTGVLGPLPGPSHLELGIVLPMAAMWEAKSDIWLSNNFNTYLLLREGVSPKQFPAYFETLNQKYAMPQFEKFTGGSAAAFEAAGDYMQYSLQNIRDIHLHSDRLVEMSVNGDIKYVWIFGTVALMVLLLACVNFMNLSTARSAHRAREVGVRKALGSNRGALVGQFLTESFVLTAISFVLALVAVQLALPAFNQFSNKSIAIAWADAPLLVGLAGLMAGTALMAGSYPAFFLSGFRPIETLKGMLSNSGRGSAWLRSGLVVFQFFASVALVTSVLVVQQQLDFIQHKKLGWDKEHVVMLRNTWWLREKMLDFKAKLLEIPGIERVSCVDYFPTPSSRNSTAFTPEGGDPARESVASQLWMVDFDYLDAMGMTIKTGRQFDASLSSDSVACVINESAAKSFGGANVVGRKLTAFLDPEMKQRIVVTVVGIVENFHSESLRESISPLVMVIGRESGTIALRLAPQADMGNTLAAVKTLFKSYLPGQPFNTRFLDDEFDRQYTTERRIGGILGAFAGFALFIACLGLFGLAAFMAEQRTKEIGVRKVLGAGVISVVALLSKDFLKLVGIAIVLAVPVAYYFMHAWLDDFAYRVALRWWMFAGAGAMAVAIAFLTVGFQGVKAALVNPVKSLRSE